MNDGVLRCAHGKLAMEVPRLDIGPGYVQAEAKDCALCASDVSFTPLPYKKGDPMKEVFNAEENEQIIASNVVLDVDPTPEVVAEIVAGLPSDHKARKERPICRGVLDYFPDAVAEVAYVSYVGNEQHNPGQPMHWAKGKSTDHADCIVRHLLERGKNDTDGLRHTAKVAWRALALLQTELDAERANGQS